MARSIVRRLLTLTRARQATQIASLALFCTLTVAGLGAESIRTFGALFSRLDPLVGLAALVASRAWIAFWALAVLTVALSVLLGRAWCGWVCPVGTLLDLLPAAGGRKSAKASERPELARYWRLGKYVTLAIVVGAAVLGRLGPMVLDPITVVTRPLQELARPYLGADGVGTNAGAFLGRDSIRSVALLSLIPLAAVLALNAVSRRTWCRTLCPLGGLLAVISKAPGLRRVVDVEACTSCGRCSRVCPTDAIEPEESFASSSAECTVCMRCVDDCPRKAIAIRPAGIQPLAPGYDPKRREAIVTAGVAGASVAAVVLPIPRDDELLRPPSTDDARLAQLCVRCGACYSACPTGSIRPSLSVTTLAGPWTPMLDERPAHCTLNCNRCARVCPTDALHTLTEDEALAMGVGGKASVDRTRCRAWARGHTCMVCQTGCPISGALKGVDRAPYVGGGPEILVPVVDTDQCVGCNLCAQSCVMHPAAIGVFAYAPEDQPLGI